MPSLCKTAFSCNGNGLGSWLLARKREEGILIVQIKWDLVHSLKEIWLLDSRQDIDFQNIHIEQLTMEKVSLFF